MNARDVLVPVGVVAAGVAVESGINVASTVLNSHRELAHRSLKLHKPLKYFLHAALYPLNDPKSWAAVHRGPHHNVTDADMLPFIQIADYADWRDEHPEDAVKHPEPPEKFDNLDPLATGITYDTARAIGSTARQLIKDEYDPAPSYSLRRSAEILDTEKPRYFYQNIRAKNAHGQPRLPGKPVTLESKHYRIRDAHAPDLHPDSVRGVEDDNMPLYVAADQDYNRDGLPDDLQRGPIETKLQKHRRKILIADIAGHVLLPAAVTLLRGGGAKRAARNGLIGGAIISGSSYLLVRGAGIVNGDGHAGQDPKEARETGVLTPFPDGSLASDRQTGWGVVTADEAENQRGHHLHPDWIAFATTWGKAPFGKAVEWLAKHRIGMEVGEGFPDGEPRPDMAHESVLMLLRERVRTMQENALKTEPDSLRVLTS